MLSNTESSSDLKPEEVLGLVRQAITRRLKIEVRYSIAAAIGMMIGSVFPLIPGILILVHGAGVPLLLLLGLAFLAGGLYYLVRGLVGVCDRSPQLTLGINKLFDHRAGREYAWADIRKASLSRTTRNGSETSATLTLTVGDFLSGDTVDINVADLDHSSTEIFRIIGERANLE
jgi:hypothetical protein